MAILRPSESLDQRRQRRKARRLDPADACLHIQALLVRHQAFLFRKVHQPVFGKSESGLFIRDGDVPGKSCGEAVTRCRRHSADHQGKSALEIDAPFVVVVPYFGALDFQNGTQHPVDALRVAARRLCRLAQHLSRCQCHRNRGSAAGSADRRQIPNRKAPIRSGTVTSMRLSGEVTEYESAAQICPEQTIPANSRNRIPRLIDSLPHPLTNHIITRFPDCIQH